MRRYCGMNEKDTAVRNSSFAYSVNMLRLLLRMKYITIEEYEKIVRISAEYYGVKVYCV